jgi:hypothetical protein
VVFALLPGILGRAAAQVTVLPLGRISASTTTGEKPQSKVWEHDGIWWTVLPSTSVSPSGTWLWKLETDENWAAVLRLSSRTDAHADAVALGDVTHVLLHDPAPVLVSLEYVGGTYTFWEERPAPTPISLSGSETATIDVDSDGRLWLATESGSNVRVYYSDPPYTGFSGPITLATNINADDITVVTALPDDSIGVFWSNQNTKRFGFRVHLDGDAPGSWLGDEVPASQSAGRISGSALADDHMNTAVGSDGTLYVSAKTSGSPEIILLVRRPTSRGRGTWDNLYVVETSATRPIVLLNEVARRVQVIYTSDTSGGDIQMRESALSPIAFGSQRTIMSGDLNNATSTKDNWVDEVVVLASGRGVLLRADGTPPSSTTTTRPPTTTTRPATTSTSSSTTTSAPGTTSTTLAGAPAAVIEADTFVRASDPNVNFGSNPLLEVDGSPTKRTFLRFRVSNIAGRTVTSARLRLQVGDVSGASSDSGGRVHRTACGWNETTLTWNTPPPAIDPAVLASAGAVALGQVVEFNVTAALTQGDGLYCFALDTTSSNGVDYRSRTGGGSAPTLLLAVAP